jgi:proteasome accessory factor A
MFTGAGKFGIEDEDRFVSAGFQISQRADFFSELQSVDTMQRRPIINTRDEPHADPHRWRRFHVILGDANMSPYATWLKVGSTALVLQLLATNPKVALSLPKLDAPLETLRELSRDPGWIRSGGEPGHVIGQAIGIQRAYIRAIQNECAVSEGSHATVLREWNQVLDDLEAQPFLCRDRLDWVAKYCLIQEFRDSEGVSEDSPWVRSLDLAYHQLDSEEGLYFGLEQAAQMRSLFTEADVRKAMTHAPTDTRAAVRGGCIRKFPNAILSAQWDHVTLQTLGGPWRLSLMDLFAAPEVLRYLDLIDRASSPDELRTWLNL